MTDKQRIEKIEEFIHAQPYIRGVLFRVDIDPEEPDGEHFLITLGKITRRQLLTVQHRLRINELFHIRCKSDQVIEYENPKKKKKRP